MSTKFPLSVERAMVEKYQIPDELVNKKMSDTHQHGRILAKMEIVDWWIHNSKLPDEDNKNVIDIIRKQPRKDVALYNKISWDMTCVRFGTVVLERKHTKQKNPLMNLSRDMREAAIMQTLAPSYVTPHTMVPITVLQELKELAESSLTSKIMFSQQVRILASQLNPQYRFTPSIPQSDDITGPLRHAICQSTWCVLNYKIPLDEKSLEVNKIVHSLGLATVQALKAFPVDWHLINEQVNSVKINGVSLRETLLNENVKPTTHVSVLKILCGIRVVIESELFGVTFSPQPAEVREATYRCQGGAQFKKYLGLEVVNFKLSGMRGQFTHNAALLVDVASNFTDLGTLREVVAAIACYCRMGFEDINASTTKELFNKQTQIITQIIPAQVE